MTNLSLNISELLGHNLSNITDINPALALPRYSYNPSYSMLLWANVIILSLLLRRYNEKISKKLELEKENKHLAYLLTDGFLMDFLHTINLFMLLYHIWVEYIPIPDPVFI